ncbi:MAG: rod shape-determining protein MreD, partial [Spirochaetes bacterium]
MKKYTITSPVLLVVIVILQTTVLKNLAFKGVKPDLVLIILVIFSNYFGQTKGELFGA